MWKRIVCTIVCIMYWCGSKIFLVVLTLAPEMPREPFSVILIGFLYESGVPFLLPNCCQRYVFGCRDIEKQGTAQGVMQKKQ